jgi:hypothetical protein
MFIAFFPKISREKQGRNKDFLNLAWGRNKEFCPKYIPLNFFKKSVLETPHVESRMTDPIFREAGSVRKLFPVHMPWWVGVFSTFLQNFSRKFFRAIFPNWC